MGIMEDKIRQTFERRQFAKLRTLHDAENNRLLQMKHEYSRLPDGRILIWEHFGMMDDIDYASRAWRKIENYRRAGYVQHTNLICTYESDIENDKVIDGIIRRFVL